MNKINQLFFYSFLILLLLNSSIIIEAMNRPSPKPSYADLEKEVEILKTQNVSHLDRVNQEATGRGKAEQQRDHIAQDLQKRKNKKDMKKEEWRNDRNECWREIRKLQDALGKAHSTTTVNTKYGTYPDTPEAKNLWNAKAKKIAYETSWEKTGMDFFYGTGKHILAPLAVQQGNAILTDLRQKYICQTRVEGQQDRVAELNIASGELAEEREEDGLRLQKINALIANFNHMCNGSDDSSCEKMRKKLHKMMDKDLDQIELERKLTVEQREKIRIERRIAKKKAQEEIEKAKKAEAAKAA